MDKRVQSSRDFSIYKIMSRSSILDFPSSKGEIKKYAYLCLCLFVSDLFGSLCLFVFVYVCLITRTIRENNIHFIHNKITRNNYTSTKKSMPVYVGRYTNWVKNRDQEAQLKKKSDKKYYVFLDFNCHAPRQDDIMFFSSNLL